MLVDWELQRAPQAPQAQLTTNKCPARAQKRLPVNRPRKGWRGSYAGGYQSANMLHAASLPGLERHLALPSPPRLLGSVIVLPNSETGAMTACGSLLSGSTGQ